MVVNKPAGMVVHPGAGNAGGTLVNALLGHCHDLSGIGGELRPGIVHRIDKDTSGVLVVAKNDPAHRSLSHQFKEHTIKRVYLALVFGSPKADKGRIESAIGRHPVDRKRMSGRASRGKQAVTHWQAITPLPRTYPHASQTGNRPDPSDQGPSLRKRATRWQGTRSTAAADAWQTSMTRN